MESREGAAARDDPRHVAPEAPVGGEAEPDPESGGDDSLAERVLTGPIDVRSIALTAILVLLVVFALRNARALLLPVLLALLAHLALAPVVRWLERRRIPAFVGAALVLVGLSGVAILGARELVEPAMTWMDQAPQSLRELERKLRFVKEPLTQVSEGMKEVEEATKVESPTVQEVAVRPPSLATLALTQATSLVAALVTTAVLLYFLLAGSDSLLRKIVESLPRFADKRRAVVIARETEAEISRYLLTITCVNAALGLAIAGVVALFGLPNPLLWGALAGLLNFVPYLGAIVSSSIIGAVSLLTFDDVTTAISLPLVCWGISALEGSLVTPTILGRRLLLSPVVVFVALLVWSWLWGIPGALVAVPTLVVLKIACDRSERLEALGVLLGR